MPATDDGTPVEQEPERLGVLWRSQGDAFIAEQARTVMADVDRLREGDAGVGPASVAAPSRRGRKGRGGDVIDLRDKASLACSRDGHGDVAAAERCTRCLNVFCAACVLQSEATHDEPLCTECALVAAGVHHKRLRPTVAHGRRQR
jgi:hypothetical protein